MARGLPIGPQCDAGLPGRKVPRGFGRRATPALSPARAFASISESHAAPKSRFLDELEDHMITESAEHTLRAVVAPVT